MLRIDTQLKTVHSYVASNRNISVSDYTLPVVTNFLCRITNSAHLVVGPSLSLDKRLGIRCQLTSVIRRVMTSLLDIH